MSKLQPLRFYFMHFMPYPDVAPGRPQGQWVDIPNQRFDPRTGHKLYKEYIDELVLADKLGYDGLVVNEHHATFYSMMPSCSAIAGALAMLTRSRLAHLTSRRIRFSPSLDRRVGRPTTSMRWNSHMRASAARSLRIYEIRDPALDHLATIVRGADTSRHDLSPQPAISLGLAANFPDDHEMLKHGMVSSVPREKLTPTQLRMTSMRRLLVTTTVSVLLGCSTAWAQVTVGTGAPAPLGFTSPLGMGPGASVGGIGIPLGATEMATPGVSPTAAGTSPLGSMTASTCSSIGASAQPTTSSPGNSSSGSSMAGSSSATGGMSAPTALFDSTGISGTASGTCASGTTASFNPGASASSPGNGLRSGIGRVGVPLGSTELGTGGLSPLPNTVQSTVTPTGSVPCPTTAATGTSTSLTSTSSSGC
jgi:hypothetical protein